MEKLSIHILGDFRFYVGNVDIAERFSQSKKKLALIECLILNAGHRVSSSSLIDMIWDGSDDLNFESSLKTLVSRVRKDLADYGLQELIVTKLGSYMWNTDIPCRIDILTFQNLCDEIVGVEELSAESRRLFDEILFVYESDILLIANASSWIVPKIYYYRNMYLNVVKKYIELLKDVSDNEHIVWVCKCVLEIEELDDFFNIELMKALLNIGKRVEAESHYERVVDLHYSQLNVKPSDKLLAFYKELKSHKNQLRHSINDIYLDLSADMQNIEGSFECDYSIFKDVYNLYARNMKRFDIPMCLLVISIDCKKEHAQPMEIDKSMRRLKEILKSNLRQGDTFSRYSLSQYAIMLSNVNNDEIARKVMKRIEKNYNIDCENLNYVLSSSIKKMDDM